MKKILIITLVLGLVATAVFSRGRNEESAQASAEENEADTKVTGGPYVANQTANAYIYIHGGYVGMAIAKTDGEGYLTVSLDEAFLPHTIAEVDIESEEWNEDNTVLFDSHGDTYAAKYVEYNGTTYVGVSAGSSITYVEADENGEPAGNTDLEKAIIRSQSTMAAYYALVQAGGFKIFTDFGGEPITVTTTSYGGLTKKNAPDYWSFGQTWIGNISAIEEFIAENGVQYKLSQAKRAEEENAEGLKVWSVADVVTGATNSDFREYLGLAQYAAGKLKIK
jgi:hypothetical protein